MSIKPHALQKGDRIGIMSPSSVVQKKDLEPGLDMLRAQGFDVYVHPQTYARHKSAAGTDALKTSALKDLFTNRDIRAIFAAGGGNHSLFLLPDIDYAMIRRHPKIFMGFSDTTALLNAFNARANLATFHGPVVKWLPENAHTEHLFALLSGKKITYPMDEAGILHTGSATGPLIGGNLTIMSYLSGTRYMPNMEGALLFIEDISEEYSNIDRLLWKLRATGTLDKISGLIVGQISKSKDTGTRKYGFSIEDMILRNTQGLNIPIVMNAPFGHVKRFYAMPVGSPAKLSARGDKVTLALTAPAVQI